MKKLILAVTIFVTFNVNAGELFWISDSGTESRLNCTIETQSHSDKPSISEYWIDCEDNNIGPIGNGLVNKSTIYINGSPVLVCPMIQSIFGLNDVFSMTLDCRSKIFKNGYEN